MARTVREARIETRTARAKLKRGRQAHWRALLPGRLRLGYQRKPDTMAGRWLLMRRRGGAYHVEPLGWADDADEADGAAVLTFEQAQAKALENADAGEGQPRYRLTVRRAIADYVEFKLAEGRNTNDTERRAAAHILPVLGDIEVADLTSTRIRRWLSDLAASPAFKRTKEGADRKFKPTPEDEEAVRRRRSSANRVLSTLKAALNHAYDEKRVASNDAWGRRVKPFRDVDVARVRYLTVAEAQRLINACAPVFRPLVIAALQTGARYSELARLTVADFNEPSGTVHVRKSKSGKPRHIVLTEEGIAFFRQTCVGRAGGELMFYRDSGAPWMPSQQGRFMSEAVTRAKISPPISFHGLRHTWASLSVMNGVPLMIVAKNLGHADTAMVEKHYGHMAPSFVADAIRAGAPKFGIEVEANVHAIR
jgi:integrase